jgi:hypothetical protein
MRLLRSGLEASFLLAVLFGSALFPGRLGYGIEPEEAVEDVVGVEEGQPTEQAYQCRNSEVVVQRLVDIELEHVVVQTLPLRLDVLTSSLTSARKGNARHAAMKRSR